MVLLVLLVPFALRGYWRGFLRESFALFGLIAGVAAAAVCWGELAAILVARGSVSPALAGPAAVALLFLAVYVAAQLAGALADRLARAVFLGGVNRAAGLAFGVAKGAALLGLVLALVMQLIPSPALRRVLSGSKLGRPLVQLATRVVEAGRSFTPPPAERRPI